MSDLDTLRQRGIKAYCIVDGSGTATGGTSNLSTIMARGMLPICQVDATGTDVIGGVTAAQLASRGIDTFCQIDESGIEPVSQLTLNQLLARGILPLCPVDITGVAQGGSLTVAQLASRGIEGFCPLDETGTASTLGLFIDRDTFYSATVVPGALTTTVDAFTDDDTFYTAAISLPGSPQTITGALYSDSDTFFASAVSGGTVTINGSLYSDSDTFFGATITQPGTYVGVGDVVPLTNYWGTRAPTLALAAGNCLDLLDQAGANAITINTTSAGDLDNAAIAAWVAAHSVTTIKVTKIYDLVGGQNLSFGTLAKMPELDGSIITGKYVLKFTNASDTILTKALTANIARPFTLGAVAYNTGIGAAGDTLFADHAFTGLYFAAGPVFQVYAGTTLNQSVSLSTWYSLIGNYPTAGNGDNVVNGTAVSGSVGAATIASGNWSIGNSDGFGIGWSGYIAEIPIFSGANAPLNSTQYGSGGTVSNSVTVNQKTYWGF